MSNISITPNASGTGTFTIAAPNSNTDRTLTLPDEAGTVLTNASNIDQSKIVASGLTYRPAFLAGFSANPSDWIAVNQNDVVPFDSTTTADCFDVGGNFSTSTHLFTAPVDGLYCFGFSCYTLKDDAIVSFYFGIDGNTHKFGASAGDQRASFVKYHSSSLDNTMAASFIVQLTANQTMGMYSSSATADVYNGSTYFYGYLV